MDTDRSSGFILQPGEGRSIDLGGFQMTVKATSEETGGAFSLLEANEPPDFGPPLHIHHDAAEAFYVLGGEYIIFLSRSASSHVPRDPSSLSRREFDTDFVSAGSLVENSTSTFQRRWWATLTS